MTCHSVVVNAESLGFLRPGLDGRLDRAQTDRLPGVLDDDTPFTQAGVPAVDLIDFEYGAGPSPGAWWHTREDNLSHVCAPSLGAVGEPALAALPAIR